MWIEQKALDAAGKIFKVEEDVFTVCFAAPGKDRPTEFTTKDGKATMLQFWKRDA